MQTTAALPIAVCVSQLAGQLADTQPVTSSPRVSVCTPAAVPSGAATGTDALVQTFQLTSEELAKFHQLNLNPPSPSNQVIELFRSKLA